MEATIQNPLSEQQRKWYDRACAKLDAKRLQELLFRLTDIHSPTGAAKQGDVNSWSNVCAKSALMHITIC